MSKRSFADRIWNRLCLKKSFRRIATPWAPIPRPDRWIFIIGCYNSGTTLLKRILAEHKAITWLPTRGGAYAEELEWPEAYGWTRMWHKCYDQLRMEPGPGAKQTARSIQRKWGLVLGQQPRNVLVKSITDAVRIPFLNAYFQPAYFIYIVRNGYAVAEGIRRKAEPGKWGNSEYKEEYPIALCANQWKETDRVVSRDLDNNVNFTTLYYEDLSENTSKVINRVINFIGLENVEKKSLKGKWSIHEKKSRIKNMNSLSLKRLSDEDVKKIQNVAGDTIRKHRYEWI